MNEIHNDNHNDNLLTCSWCYHGIFEKMQSIAFVQV